MPKWMVNLLIASGLFASTAGQSIAQFELTPEMPATQGSESNATASKSSTISAAKGTASGQRFPQVGEVTISMTSGIFWLAGISSIWIWQGGRRHAH